MKNPREVLLQKLRQKKKEGYSLGQISASSFIYQPNQEDLRELWEEAHKHHIQEKWGPFVRFAFLNEDEKRALSYRTARLLLKNKKSLLGYYEISRESSSYQLPDRLSDFIRLRMIANEYFDIYRKIMRRINFEYPPSEFSSKIIKGKINWKKTIQKSKTYFPSDFELRIWNRQFDTPENRLLLLISHWLQEDCKNILKNDLEDPLQDDEKKILIEIASSVNQILTRLPFNEILNSLKEYTFERKNSEKIQNLLLSVKKRITDGKIRNPQYRHLYAWITKYSELDFENSVQNKQKFVIKKIEDIDALYEVFIFLEFFEYLKNIKKINPVLKKHSKGKKYKILFEIEGRKLEFYHGKTYSIESKQAWALDAEPDYSVEFDNQILAVFDAKNYQKYSSDKNTAKILDGLIHLNLTTRDLDRFKRKYPEIEENIVEKYLKLINTDQEKAEEFRKKEENKARIENKRVKADKKKDNKRGPKEQILSYLANLDVKYGGLIFPKYDFEHKESSTLQKETIHIRDLILETLRLDYHPKEMLPTRVPTMEAMWAVIESRVKEVQN